MVTGYDRRPTPMLTSEQIREQRDQLRGLWDRSRALPKGSERDAAIADARTLAEKHREDVDDAVRAAHDRDNRKHLTAAVERLCDALAQRPTTQGAAIADDLVQIVEDAADAVTSEVLSWAARHTGTPDEEQTRQRIDYALTTGTLARHLRAAADRAEATAGFWRESC